MAETAEHNADRRREPPPAARRFGKEASGAMFAASSRNSVSGGSKRPCAERLARPSARSARSSTSAVMSGATESCAPVEPTI